LGAAVDYLTALGMENVREHERELSAYALEQIQTVPGIKILGPLDANARGGVLAFDLANVHPHDIATILDQAGICVRAGHHCAMPLHEQLGLGATTRASFYIYNTPDEIDQLVKALHHVREVFK
jgi:cysteine desulfurase/selenocysteine lyase